MINILKEFGALNNCYKIIVDCADHNIKFYELVSFHFVKKILVWF